MGWGPGSPSAERTEFRRKGSEAHGAERSGHEAEWGEAEKLPELAPVAPAGFWGLEFFLSGNRVLLNGEAWREGKDLQN